MDHSIETLLEKKIKNEVSQMVSVPQKHSGEGPKILKLKRKGKGSQCSKVFFKCPSKPETGSQKFGTERTPSTKRSLKKKNKDEISKVEARKIKNFKVMTFPKVS